MAKKKKKALIKLNNKIRDYFNGEAFDEGVTTLDDDKLIELSMLLELELSTLQRDELIRSLRRAWSEGRYIDREKIVKHLVSNGAKMVQASDKKPLDKVDKILLILEDIEHTKDEESRVLESFMDTRASKINAEKIEQKLHYIRLQKRIKILEDSVGVSLTTLNEMEFYHGYKFEMRDIDFNKNLLTISTPVELEELWDSSDESIIEHMVKIKEQSIVKKEREIENFIEHISKEHKWLTQEQIVSQIKRMPPEVELYHIPIDMELLESIVKSIDSDYWLYESIDHFIIERAKSSMLYGEEVEYKISVSYTKDLLYSDIWRSVELPIANDLEQIDSELHSHFKLSVDSLYDHLVELSDGLGVPTSKIESIIVEFVAPQIKSSQTLKIKEKSKRRILYHFGEYLKPIKEQRMREELLAKTIRDFKNLFPLARSLKREIVFHVGPTNSGKTYTALQELKSADTGYYLAPLRLLALEGYESLKADGVGVSLITGEEEIIDEESTHISSTIEMLNSSIDVEVCVIDEIQMIDDRDRGWAWANALIGVAAKKVILTGSSNALAAVRELCQYLEEPLEVVEFERKNPLVMLSNSTPLHKVEKQSAIVAFSRKEVLSLKQQLSTNHRVSVVYGNLSPEVRREEARRFREGESDILVATDAIAMGLNLPIKTILFAKDNKFDGLRRRELTPSEVLQISGRAGRYGLEECGYIGALESSAIKTIKRQFHTPLADIKLPFSVMASMEHVELIGEILQSDNLVDILEFFADNMEFDGPFKAANIDSMLEIASIVDEYELDIRTRYHLSCAPASISSPYIESVFHRYIRNIENGSEVLYIPPRDLPAFAQTNDMLLNAEDRVREISLYLWLSFKFPDYFRDTQKAIESRVRLNQYIENSLQRGYFVKKCRKCGKVLDFSYRFSICDSCFRGGGSSRYRGKRRDGRGDDQRDKSRKNSRNKNRYRGDR
ncbi:Probable ATP-dependent RNA helicase [hydrothermal vent metagenome]|uniref:Probable ATP-dependent RNA helicase n=1 Tax=hydrothermal vent metagenome TaxID=652676 RepID=A0A1W1BE51_9ZZZZ